MVAAAPVPSNELARLDSLYSHHILDTPPDERFDLFTRMSTWLLTFLQQPLTSLMRTGRSSSLWLASPL